MFKRVLLFGLSAAIALIHAVDAHDPNAPPTRIATVTDTYHGVQVEDPYRWLENGTDPGVRVWTTAQTARTRASLDALPYRSALEARLMALTSEASPSYRDFKSGGGRLFFRYTDPAKQQPMLAVMTIGATAPRVFLDPNVLDPSGSTAVDWYVPSLDGRRVAASLSRGGSEDGDLHLFDVETGREFGEVIPHVQYPTAGGSAAWTEDGTGIWYTRFPGPERPDADRHFYQTVWFHRIRTDLSTDRPVLADGLPRVAEIRLDYSPAARALLVTVANGDGGQYAHYVVDRSGVVRQITRFEDEVDFAAFGPDGGLYLVSEQNSPRGRILKLAAGDYSLANARAVVPEGADVIPTEFFGEDPFVFAGRIMAVRYLAGGPSRLRFFDLDGRPLGQATLPPVASVAEIEALGTDLLYSVETYLTPRTIRRRSADGRDVEETGLRMTSPIRYDDMEVTRITARSRDGTNIPVNIIRRRGLALDGTHPTLLYGYGGYGRSETPSFLGAVRRVFFDAGGVLAIANLRGGGEFGEEWHANGALTRKQNVFDDFIAAAQWLVDERYTVARRLAIQGGSNGGLLMGAVLTQRPEMFRAVVSSVGVYDMLRVELDPNGEFNTTEFGTVKNVDQFRALYAYSPYHRVRNGVAYPAVLLQAGENDGRVNPWHSRKMAARLQAATGSDRPVLLATTSDAGHGIGSPLRIRVEQWADQLAFLFDQLGMTWTPPNGAAQRTDNTAPTASVLGAGRGIDHVVVVVRDLEDAERVYRDVLGFRVAPGGTFPGGLRNSAVFFGTNYLELITVAPSQAAGSKVASDLATFLQRREGASLLGLNVSSARQTADFLRVRGFDVTEPEGSSFTPDGAKEVQTTLWQTVAFKKPVLPADAVFFIQYGPRPERPNRPPHPNTAVGIHSVWMAVKDLAAATRAYESVGLRAGRKVRVPRLGATGQEVAAGQGVIVLLQPDSAKGSLASFLAEYAEGIVGMTIEVRDIEAARRLLRTATGQELASYTTANGKAILVSPNLTRGVWIELFQRRG